MNQKENEKDTNLSNKQIQKIISNVIVASEVPADGDCDAHSPESVWTNLG